MDAKVNRTYLDVNREVNIFTDGDRSSQITWPEFIKFQAEARDVLKGEYREERTRGKFKEQICFPTCTCRRTEAAAKFLSCLDLDHLENMCPDS